MGISKKKRFNIFRRDDFTCQYCGRQSPIVILEIDHLTSKADGGDDSEDNLITSCRDCNRGKGSSSTSAEELKEGKKEAYRLARKREEQRREFEQFMLEQRSLRDQMVEDISIYWESGCEYKWLLNDSSRFTIRKFLNSLTIWEIIDAIDIARNKIPSPQNQADIEGRFRYFCGICHNWIRSKHNMEKEDEKMR